MSLLFVRLHVSKSATFQTLPQRKIFQVISLICTMFLKRICCLAQERNQSRRTRFDGSPFPKTFSYLSSHVNPQYSNTIATLEPFSFQLRIVTIFFLFLKPVLFSLVYTFPKPPFEMNCDIAHH